MDGEGGGLGRWQGCEKADGTGACGPGCAGGVDGRFEEIDGDVVSNVNVLEQPSSMQDTEIGAKLSLMQRRRG